MALIYRIKGGIKNGTFVVSVVVFSIMGCGV